MSPKTFLGFNETLITNDIKSPKRERKLAMEPYTSLISSIEQLKLNQAEIEIEETGKRIILPVKDIEFIGRNT